jgi:hypothetical protein
MLHLCSWKSQDLVPVNGENLVKVFGKGGTHIHQIYKGVDSQWTHDAEKHSEDEQGKDRQEDW